MISVIIITKNEEDRIKTCLESVKWADEIVVVDNGSTDKTLEIVKKYTDNISSFEGQDFATLRNKAMEKAKGDWVLYVDADERVTNDLKEEIIRLTNTQYAAFAISRRNIIFGEEKSYGPFWPDWVIRLLKKDKFEKWVGRVHEYPKFNGGLGYTKNSFIHLTHRNLEQVVAKSLSWSTIDAQLRFQSGHPKMTGWRFLRILVTELFTQGLRRKGFFAGTVGVIDSLLQTFSLIMTYVRLWEIQQAKSLDERYDDLDKKLIEDDFKY